ncbi:MAG: viperin family antiviral radical SAM protein [Clostridia bacterium]|nr:viperin family antiviral radical SAM protein [Clostridia bacterium]
MKKFNVINYHITNKCNYHCTYCFGKFKGQDPSIDEAKKIINNIASYFRKNKINDGRINFAGGEPTLYKHLDELIDYSNSLGITTSIITNGYLLTPERIRSWKGKISIIGISVDSLSSDSNNKIGRCYLNNSISLTQLKELSNSIHECNIDLKINTVVSKLNINENFSELYRALKPKKIKLFQMHLIDGINNKSKKYEITKKEFDEFCKKHQEFESIIIAEPCGSMENSYLMINPEGEFQLNNNGNYKTFGNLNTNSLYEILKNVPLDSNKFNLRYLKEGSR